MSWTLHSRIKSNWRMNRREEKKCWISWGYSLSKRKPRKTNCSNNWNMQSDTIWWLLIVYMIDIKCFYAIIIFSKFILMNLDIRGVVW